MKNDSLKFTQNDDGTFQLEWDKEDPNWSFLNSLTSDEISVMIQKAIQDDLQKKNDL